MKPIGEHLKYPTAARPSTPAPSATPTCAPSTTPSPDVDDALAWAWGEIRALYPSLFYRRHGAVGGEGYATWLKTLADLTPDQIWRGVERLRREAREYPPDAPVFRRLCHSEPEALGLPDVRAAYIAASNREWIHPIVWHAVQELACRGLSPSDLRSRPERETYAPFRQVYDRLVERADRGERFERPGERVALSHDTVTVAPEYRDDPAAARAAFFAYGSRRRDDE